MIDHVTPSVAADLLRRHGLRAGRRYGQHFLVDPNTVRRIIRLAEISPDETILEIGPGLGSLTVALAGVAGRVVAVEVDAVVLPALAQVVGEAHNVKVVHADALKADLDAHLDGPARLVANLPYNVATPILMRVLDELPLVAGGLVMVQKEVGERWTAASGSRVYGAVSVHASYRAQLRIVGDVPASVFMPPPDVASVLVAFERWSSPPVKVDEPETFFAFVRSAFSHRRKTLRNSLVATGVERPVVEQALAHCGLDAKSRPETLTLQAYAELYDALRAGAAA